MPVMHAATAHTVVPVSLFRDSVHTAPDTLAAHKITLPASVQDSLSRIWQNSPLFITPLESEWEELTEGLQHLPEDWSTEISPPEGADMPWTEEAELLQEEISEGEQSELIRTLEELHTHPVDLNRASRDELYSLPFLTDLQAEQLYQYRHRRGGSLSSIYDLKEIPFWTDRTIALILPFVTLTAPAVKETHAPIKPYWETTHSLAYRNADMPVETLGDPYALRSTLSLHGTQLTGGVIYKKSAGEPWLFRNKFPYLPFVSGYLAYEFARPLMGQAFVGDYKVSLGTGLICNQHAGAYASATTLSGILTRNRITGAKSSDEWNYLRGAALRLAGSNGWEVLAFLSYTPLNGKVVAAEEIGAVNTSGLIRTASDLERWHTAHTTSAGGRFSRRLNRWQVGINTIGHLWYPHKLQYLPGYIVLKERTEGKNLLLLSADYTYYSRTGNWRASGEVATCGFDSWATLHALSYHTQGGVVAMIQGRYLSAGYQTLYGRALTRFSHPGNEWGGRLSLYLPLTAAGSLFTYIDAYSSVIPRWRAKEPTKGYKVSVQAQYYLLPKLLLSGRFSQSGSSEEKSSFSNAKVSLLYGNVIPVRLSYSWRRNPGYTPSDAHMAGAEASYKQRFKLRMPVDFKLTTAAYYYHAGAYRLAQYPYLPFVTASGGFTPLYGRGVAVSGLLSLSAAGKFKAQLAYTQLLGKKRLTASGGATNWESSLQLYLSYRF